MKLRNLFFICAIGLTGGQINAATTVTGATFTNGATFGNAATLNTNHVLTSISTAATTYSILEGGTATGGTGDFQITSFDNATMLDADPSMSGLNLSRGVGNGTATFAFTQNLSLYSGFVIFDYASSTGDDVWSIEAINGSGTTVGSYNAGSATFGTAALKGPSNSGGGWYRTGGGGRIGGTSDGPAGLFFALADFTASGDISTAVRFKIVDGAGAGAPDPFALVAVTIPEPSSALLGALGVLFLLRRKR